MPTDYDADRLFPAAECISAIGELSAWTSVQAILAGARHLEGRPGPLDQLEPTLIVPIKIDDVFESILTKALGWLIAGYVPPAAKIALAQALDPAISDHTAAALANRRFRPNISRAAPGPFAGLPADSACFVIHDDPLVIEMIQAPVICMIDLLRRFSETAQRIALELREHKEATGGSGKAFHRPYADSRLPAILEALCFWCWGLDFGPVWGEVGEGSADISYRAVNIHGVPPLDPRMVDAAHQAMERMLASLR